MSETTKRLPYKRVLELLSPSALGSVIYLVASLSLVLSVIFINRYRSSSLKLQYQYYQSHHTISNSYLTGSILQNSVVKDLPLVLFWALVGVVVYLIGFDVIKTLRSAVELREELNYVHVHRLSLIKDVFTKFAVRVVAIGLLLPCLLIFFHRIIPYCIKIAILTTAAGNLVGVIGYTVLAIIVASAAIHINLILIRLVFLKPRLFSNILD